MQIFLIALNAKYSHTNLAVRYLRHALADAGFCAEIAEYTINQQPREILADLAARAATQKQDASAPCFLFSCYLWNVTLVRCLGEDLRRLFPDCRILLGGPEVSFDAETLLPNFPFADAIVCGEGELSLPQILRQPVIAGVYPARAYVDLDTLAFPYDDLAELEHRVLYYEASRGCPFGCAYCLSAADRKVRFRALPLVEADLQSILDARAMQVKFVDRTFNADAARALAIWRYLIAHDNGVTSFQMEIGGDLLTADQLALLETARPGLFQFEVGVQSTCAAALEACCRATDWARLTHDIGALRAAGRVHLHLDLIAGLPGEGFERFLQSFDEVFALAPHQLQLGFLKLLRGAPLYAAQTRYKLVCSPYPPYEVLSTADLSFAELTRLKALEDMVEVYYNSVRFQTLLTYLLAVESSPARFFLALADVMPAVRPGKYAFYDLLYTVGVVRGGDADTLGWLMRYDLCLHERPRRLPRHCAAALALTRRELPELPATVHCERFPFDPAASGGAAGAPVTLAFDYAVRDMFGRAQVFRL